MKKYGIEKPCIRGWRQRTWYVSKVARDRAFKRGGGKKVSKEVPDER